MRNAKTAICLMAVCVMALANFTSADTFGTGDNQFTIDFVPISGSTNPTSGIPAGSGFTFMGVANDYRMGTYEVTNDQWTKFTTINGVPKGNPSSAYEHNPTWPSTNVPINNVSWYEAAQFVNWLNTSKGHQAAYKFTGTQGMSNYTLGVWESGDIGYNASNPYRNNNAFYFLPTEDEWVKAAYWNDTSLQNYATKDGSTPGEGSYSNYNKDGNATGQPWAVGSGSEELNGTFDMMGNFYELLESPWTSGDYLSASSRGYRGGSYGCQDIYLMPSYRDRLSPQNEHDIIGFRVASIPEPASAAIMILGTVWLAAKRK